MNKKHSKRYLEILKKTEQTKFRSSSEILNFLRENSSERLPNIKVSFSFYWDEKKTPLRGNISLPYPAEKPKKIAIVGEELPPILQNKEIKLVNLGEISQLVNRKKSSWGFQVLLAHSSLQEKIKPLAKVLGPKKIFPNSKDGTLTDNLAATVEEINKGRMEIRSDKDGNLHVPLGKTDFSLEQLEKNYQTLLKFISINLKPTNWKGKYLRHVTFSTAMGPGIRIFA